MLRLDIGTLPEGLSHADLSDDVSEWGDSLEGGRLESPVTVSLDIDRTGHDVFVKGKASVNAILECARCLEEYAFRLEAPIRLWVILGAAGGEIGTEDRENVIEVQAGAKYADLTDHVRSGLLVQIPLKQLCKPECRGLCRECGVNLNTGSCGCQVRAQDSRWEALKKLKDG
jgi:uncharacterized protein